MKYKQLFTYLLAIIIILWSILAIIRSGYNLTKLLTEEPSWLNLSYDQKQTKLHGDLYLFIDFVKKNTSEHSKILFIAPGGKAYYLARYFLYPRIITYEKNTYSNYDSYRYDYIVTYQTTDKELDENNSFNWVLPNLTVIRMYQDENNSKGNIYKL